MLNFAATAGLESEAPRVVEMLRTLGVEASFSTGAADDAAGLLDAVRKGEVDFALTDEVGRALIPEELHLAAVLPRDEPRDVLIPSGPIPHTLSTLPHGARVGAATARRRGFLRAHRHDVRAVEPGNGAGPVEALEAGGVDAIVMSAAEARRLSLGSRVSELLDAKSWVPGPGQAVLLLTSRRDGVGGACALVDHPGSRTALDTELAVLGPGEGLRDVPLGALAVPHGRWIRAWGMVASPDGRHVVRGDVTGRMDDPDGVGRALRTFLLSRGAGPLLEERPA